MKIKIILIAFALNLFQYVQGQSPYSFINDETKTLHAINKNDTIISIIGYLSDSTLVMAKFNYRNHTIIYEDNDGKKLYTDSLSICKKAFFSIDPRAEEMTEISPYVYCLGNPINFIDHNGESPSAYEAALMADVAYIDNLSVNDLPKDLVDSGWTLSSFETSITMNYTAWYQNGLQSVLFERTIDGITEYAYVFAGTASIEDAFEDITQFLYGWAPQYSYAIYNAKTLSREIGDNELTFVGHSLGGGEAAASSMATGRSAITFNAASVHPFMKWRYNLGNTDKIYNYRIIAPGEGDGRRYGGCFISNFQDNIGRGADGHQIWIKAPNHDPIAAHSISNFINFFKKERRCKK